MRPRKRFVVFAQMVTHRSALTMRLMRLPEVEKHGWGRYGLARQALTRADAAWYVRTLYNADRISPYISWQYQIREIIK